MSIEKKQVLIVAITEVSVDMTRGCVIPTPVTYGDTLFTDALQLLCDMINDLSVHY